MPHTPISGQRHRRDGYDPETTTSLSGENGSSIWPATPVCDNKTRDHHHPNQRRRCGASLFIGPLWPTTPTATSGGPDPRADQAECNDRERDAEQRMRLHPRGRDGGEQPAGRKTAMPPTIHGVRRAPEIRAVTPRRPEHLEHIVIAPARPAGSRASPVRPPSRDLASRL